MFSCNKHLSSLGLLSSLVHALRVHTGMESLRWPCVGSIRPSHALPKIILPRLMIATMTRTLVKSTIGVKKLPGDY